MEAAKSYFAESIIDENNLEDKVFSFENGAINDLSYSGSKPKGGMLVLSKTGEIELAIHNNEWCAIKSKTENNVRLIKYEKDKCKLSEEVEIPLISVKDTKSETIEKGLNKSILEYFNIVSGTATCVDTLDSNKEVTNTGNLAVGIHNIECTVVENGKTGKATKTLVVESSGTELDAEKMIAEVGENGSIRTDNLGNKRYAGSNPNNWACFGTQNETCDDNHLYRIIGVIDGKMKIIKNSFYSTRKAWDTTGGPNGSTNWDRPADLKTELNGTSFYKNTNYIDEISRSYIENATWYIGGIKSTYTLENFEDNERSLSSTGYIGLMSVTDYGYASNNTGCERPTTLEVCINNNYLFNGGEWTITPISGHENYVWNVNSEGYVISNGVTASVAVRPSLFLKPEVKITSGKGTETEPYRLGM